MHPTELAILKYLLRKGVSKHVTLNIMSRISYARHYCATPYRRCHDCKTMIQTCKKCSKIITCCYCDNTFCKDCAINKDTRSHRYVCKECYSDCAKCGNNSSHECYHCNYKLCSECYRYSKIEYIAGEKTYEVCYNCRKRI